MYSGYMYRLNRVKVPNTMFSDDQPPHREPEECVDVLGSPVDGDHVGVSHDYFLHMMFLRYAAYAKRPTMSRYSRIAVIIVCVFNSAAGNDW
jgi:hypothetical protein